MSHPITLVKFVPTIAGYKPFKWRYRNGKWEDMSSLKGRHFPLFQFIMDEIHAFGKVTEQVFKDGKIQKKNGFYVVDYQNCV